MPFVCQRLFIYMFLKTPLHLPKKKNISGNGLYFIICLCFRILLSFVLVVHCGHLSSCFVLPLLLCYCRNRILSCGLYSLFHSLALTTTHPRPHMTNDLFIPGNPSLTCLYASSNFSFLFPVAFSLPPFLGNCSCCTLPLSPIIRRLSLWHV